MTFLFPVPSEFSLHLFISLWNAAKRLSFADSSFTDVALESYEFGFRSHIDFSSQVWNGKEISGKKTLQVITERPSGW